METIELKAEERKLTGKKVKHLRKKGQLPAVVYARDFAALPLILDLKQYKKVISGEAGTNVIITLDIKDGKDGNVPVITHSLQRNILTDEIIHVDFHKINMKEKIRTKIPVEVAGLAIGVKEEAGIFVHSLTELEIECLPMDIPDKVEIDISGLKIGDSLQVKNLREKLKQEVAILTSEEEIVASVVPPAKEEVAAPPTEGAVAAEGAVPAEGAAPVEGKAPAEGVEAKKEEKGKTAAVEKPSKKSEK